MTNYRKLSPTEITRLCEAGNRSRDWNTIEVSEDFTPDNITGCTFSGKVKIGCISGDVLSPGGVKRQSALRYTEFIDCTIGDGVYISNTGSYIANYDIGHQAYIENNGVIEASLGSTFGNGVMVATVNEGGGREVPIYDALTSQTAYIIAMYRHRPQMVENLTARIIEYGESFRGRPGVIGQGASVTGCSSITDVRIGDYAKLSGAAVLRNGTVNSTREKPTRVGNGVRAYDFILTESSSVDDGVIIKRCFVGEACKLSSAFSAADSLFFANSECENGEACSIFAGPYTVGHHKSSLLIAGIFSFFNAGSGSNQSNHLFRTGPIHQGVHERGCKFASDAYIMLPAREGAFTVVLGRHRNHHNSENFPFSYLMEEEGKSFLLPGINLRSYGSVRDMKKWPQRDRRTGEKRDRIHFDHYNPYMGERFLRALDISRGMLEKKGVEVYNYERMRIRHTMLKRGAGFYEMALNATLAHLLSQGEGKAGYSQWSDIAGMFAPVELIDEMLTWIETQNPQLAQVEERFDEIFSHYGGYAHSWALGVLEKTLGHVPAAENITAAIERGSRDMESLKRMTDEDALKDSDVMMRTGYGIDAEGDAAIVEQDFRHVRKL